VSTQAHEIISGNSYYFGIGWPFSLGTHEGTEGTNTSIVDLFHREPLKPAVRLELSYVFPMKADTVVFF
jgi:hypothetical protein